MQYLFYILKEGRIVTKMHISMLVDSKVLKQKLEHQSTFSFESNKNIYNSKG